MPARLARTTAPPRPLARGARNGVRTISIPSARNTAGELALLQPTPGYMRLKESPLRIWTARKAAVREEIAFLF